MATKYISSIMLLMLLCIVLISCNKEDPLPGNVTNISQNGLLKSHNMGQNCMRCHVEGDRGKGWFNVAGTVFDSLGVNTYPNATIKLYTGPNGTGIVKYTIEVDANGNFYTTEEIDLTIGLYASVEGNKIKNYMGEQLMSGKCNNCHNLQSNRIWVR